MQRMMRTLGISQAKSELFSALLSYDTIGLFLKNEIPLSEAFDNMLEMANSAHADPDAFYRLAIAFHMVDAASYPFLLARVFEVQGDRLAYEQSRKELLLSLFHRISLIPQGEASFHQLVEAASSNQLTYPEYHKAFLAALPELTVYLEARHKSLLRLSEDEERAQRDSFRELKKGLQSIMAYLVEHHPNSEGLKQSYLLNLNNADEIEFGPALNRLFVEKLSESSPEVMYEERKRNEINIKELVLEMFSFRRSYFVRYRRRKWLRFLIRQDSCKSTISSEFQRLWFELGY